MAENWRLPTSLAGPTQWNPVGEAVSFPIQKERDANSVSYRNDFGRTSTREGFGTSPAVAAADDVDLGRARPFRGGRLFRATAVADVRQLGDGRLRRDRNRWQIRQTIARRRRATGGR